MKARTVPEAGARVNPSGNLINAQDFKGRDDEITLAAAFADRTALAATRPQRGALCARLLQRNHSTSVSIDY